MKLFNQVDITFDYFCDKRDRILMRRASWPALLGYVSATPWSNIGKVENKGIELGVNWKKEVFKGFHVDFRGNFTYTEINTSTRMNRPIRMYGRRRPESR